MIDWTFIEGREGYATRGYVPDVAGSESGVTIAHGVDLGQIGRTTLAMLPADVRALVDPYVGLKRETAEARLAASPLTLTDAQCASLDSAVRTVFERNLALHFDNDRASSCAAWESIPDACQTVIASVAYQYGSVWAPTVTPKFWRLATSGDWLGMRDELKDFGDRYPSRREAEAAYLTEHLGLD